MIRNLCIVLLFLIPKSSGAGTIEVDGIYYELDTFTKEATVARGHYSGYIKIPSLIEYEGVKYTVTTIGAYCFADGGLTSVDIPSTITTIKESAFDSCTKLSYVNITDLESWLKIEFEYMSNPLRQSHSLLLNGNEITELVVPNGITSLNNYVFEEWSALKKISIPASVTTIGHHAFYGCSGLTSIDLPNSITSIGWYAFDGCKGLSSFIIPKGITTIEQCTFANCSNLASIDIPSSVQLIDYNAFQGAGLEVVILPEGVNTIRGEAFCCKNLSYISIPKSIKVIENYAFFGNIKDVYCYSEEIPNTSETAFGTNYEWDHNSIWTATLHVPTSAISKYKRISPWSYFGNIVEIEGGGGENFKCEKPTISYHNGKLTFNSDTKGAICHSTVTDDDIKSYDGDEIQLGVTYNISVYATKEGYQNSETATATLCWIDVEPKTEGITDGMAQMGARAIMVKTEGGQLIIEGAEDNTNISVYSVDGVQVGTTISRNGVASIMTAIPKDSVAIVKIGNKSVKVMMK